VVVVYRAPVRPAVAACLSVLVAVVGTRPAATDRWETTRRTVIDPLNTAIHRHLPADVKKRDPDALLALYATDTGTGLRWDAATRVYPDVAEETVRWTPPGGPEPIRVRWERLFAVFPTIEKAELRIGRVGWTDADADGWPVDLRLIVRGTRADGARAVLDQRAAVRLAARDGGWRITREEITARELVARRAPAFALATDAAGIANVHTNADSPAFHLFGGQASGDAAVAASAGSAVGDVDGDGCEDVFSPASRAPSSIGTAATGRSRT
jgi:hypothetical protein